MTNIIKIILYLFLYTGLLNYSYSATDTYPFSNKNDNTRFQTFSHEIRCVVCQYQNIGDSNAPLAKDIRNKIYSLINHKKSDEEIKFYLQKRYGEFILLEPVINKSTFFLWAFPFLGLIIILLIPVILNLRS